jgi:hypothetical protein
LFLLSQAASVATLPSALFVSDCRSVQVGCTRFSRSYCTTRRKTIMKQAI